MPADAPPRWITVRKPFDYMWPGRSAMTHFAEPGDQLVKAEVADFAVKSGYATEGKVDGSARSKKTSGGKTPRKRKPKKDKPAAPTADAPPVPPVGDADSADPDRPADRPAVDSDAG